MSNSFEHGAHVGSGDRRDRQSQDNFAAGALATNAEDVLIVAVWQPSFPPALELGFIKVLEVEVSLGDSWLLGVLERCVSFLEAKIVEPSPPCKLGLLFAILALERWQVRIPGPGIIVLLGIVRGEVAASLFPTNTAFLCTTCFSVVQMRLASIPQSEKLMRILVLFFDIHLTCFAAPNGAGRHTCCATPHGPGRACARRDEESTFQRHQQVKVLAGAGAFLELVVRILVVVIIVILGTDPFGELLVFILLVQELAPPLVTWKVLGSLKGRVLWL
mmetsp:Transcript_15718/g.50109  ORF Transcript_15718/g.50109 Transcript_15718/m.50109 type:complete len:275 (+) Transcript_15718:362-1186(+)